MQAFNAKALGLACGILWTTAVVLMGLTSLVCSWARPFVTGLGTFYVGYEASLFGVLIGSLWAFVDGFIGGFVLAWLYNRLNK